MTTLTEVTTFIASEATQEDIDRIYEVAKTRTRHLRDVRAAGVIVGTTVVITNISPKSLNGLSGVVKSIEGKYATVTLDAASTKKLARSRTRHGARVGLGVDSYDMTGIPLTTCSHA